MYAEYAHVHAVMQDRLRVAESERRARSARAGRPVGPARRVVQRWVGSLRAGDAA
jgi:hypothetical protein